ncbi:hypothetical protein [Kitasatospora sp. NPDC098663]|uniref:hypothetical protein n=1 Tax=Kitasatospora sp. NPDC098663 TaxID=3364096 RepID=UPI0037FDD401
MWHCAIRDHPDAPRLTDSQWAATARRVLAATGIVPADEPSAGCRWVALRTGSHEVRIIAPLMRPDGTVPPLHRDHSLAHAACQLADLELSNGRRRAATSRTGHGPVSSAAPETISPTWPLANRPSMPRR